MTRGTNTQAFTVAIIALIAIIAFLLFRYRRSKVLEPIVSRLARTREHYRGELGRRASDTGDETLLTAAADIARDDAVRSPSPPPYPGSQRASVQSVGPMPICLTTIPIPDEPGSSLSLLSDQLTPASVTFTPIPSWCPGTTLQPPPKIRTAPSKPAMPERGSGRRSFPMTAIFTTYASSETSSLAPSTRGSANSITSCSTCVGATSPRFRPPPDTILPTLPPSEEKPGRAESHYAGDRRTNHSGWSEWFRPHDDLAGQRNSTASLGGVSIASSAVLTSSMVSGPTTPTKAHAGAAVGDQIREDGRATAEGRPTGRSLTEPLRRSIVGPKTATGLLSPFGVAWTGLGGVWINNFFRRSFELCFTDGGDVVEGAGNEL